MNQLDPSIQIDAAHRSLSPMAMHSWSANLFDLVVTLSRQPVAVTGGLCSARLALGVATSNQQGIIAEVPLSIGSTTLTLHLSADAVDGLAARLEGPGALPAGAGATLSLDALEALLAALLAPIPEILVGRASWVDGSDADAVLALTADETGLLLSGETTALRALYETLHARTDRMVSTPLAVAALPLDQRLTVDVEKIVGQVALNEVDLTALHAGAGILPDQLWPNGLTLIGRRFTLQDGSWQSQNVATQDGSCLLRVAKTKRTLDDPRLGAALPDDGPAELFGTSGVLATGRLVMADWQGEPRQVFQIDQLVG